MHCPSSRDSSNSVRANNHMGAEGIHSNGNKNGEIEQIKLHLTSILNFLASLDNRLTTIVNFHAFLENHRATMLNIPDRTEKCMATNQDPGTASVVTDTPSKKDAENRKKGLLSSIYTMTEKLLMFCGTLFLGLMSYSSAPKAGQNFEDPWMQPIITGSVILFFSSFILLALASNMKEREAIDGILFKIFKWLLLPVLLTLWPGLCMIVHFCAHTSSFVLWPLGALCSISSVSIWVWAFCKEQPKILEELRKGYVLENGMLLEKAESEAASAPGLDGAKSYTVQISGVPSTSAYAINFAPMGAAKLLSTVV